MDRIKRSPRRYLFVLGSLLAATLVGCASGDEENSNARAGASPEVRTIEISTFVFTPKSLEIAPGTTVRWTNGDAILHTATSGVQKEQGVPGVDEGEAARPDGTFDLEMDGKGSSAEFTFDEPGTYRYFCRLHAAMTGTVVVE